MEHKHNDTALCIKCGMISEYRAPIISAYLPESPKYAAYFQDPEYPVETSYTSVIENEASYIPRYCKDCGGEVIIVDGEMAPILKYLHSKGIETSFSCTGDRYQGSHVMLKDGKLLYRILDRLVQLGIILKPSMLYEPDPKVEEIEDMPISFIPLKLAPQTVHPDFTEIRDVEFTLMIGKDPTEVNVTWPSVDPEAFMMFIKILFGDSDIASWDSLWYHRNQPVEYSIIEFNIIPDESED